MKDKISVSYCICVWNEHAELSHLLKCIKKYICENDEIIIQGDQGKVTDEVVSVIRTASKDPKVKYIEYPLKKDFAAFKNNAIKNCSGDFIFLIDPDEVPHPMLLDNLKQILLQNQDVDAFALPRVNVVQGLTDEYVKSQGWNLSILNIPKLDYESKDIMKVYGVKSPDGGLPINTVNFPDYQWRIFRNSEDIRYSAQTKVHEQLVGCNIKAEFPFKLSSPFTEFNFSYSLFHVKDFQRQVRQNKFYDSFHA